MARPRSGEAGSTSTSSTGEPGSVYVAASRSGVVSGGSASGYGASPCMSTGPEKPAMIPPVVEKPSSASSWATVAGYASTMGSMVLWAPTSTRRPVTVAASATA